MNRNRRREITQTKEALGNYLAGRHGTEDQHAMGQFVWLMNLLDEVLKAADDLHDDIINQSCEGTHTLIHDPEETVAPICRLVHCQAHPEQWDIKGTPEVKTLSERTKKTEPVRSLRMEIACTHCDKTGTHRVLVKGAGTEFSDEIWAMRFSMCIGCRRHLLFMRAVDTFDATVRIDTGGYIIVRFMMSIYGRMSFGLVGRNGEITNEYTVE